MPNCDYVFGPVLVLVISTPSFDASFKTRAAKQGSTGKYWTTESISARRKGNYNPPWFVSGKNLDPAWSEYINMFRSSCSSRDLPKELNISECCEHSDWNHAIFASVYSQCRSLSQDMSNMNDKKAKNFEFMSLGNHC